MATHNENTPFLPQIENTSLKAADHNKFDWIESSHAGAYDAPKSYLGVSIDTKKTIRFFGAIIVLVGILFSRTAYLQVVEGDTLKQQATQNKVREIEIPANRGVIFDKNGAQIVFNEASFDLMLTTGYLPKDEEERREELEYIANLAQRPLEEIIEIDEDVAAFAHTPIRANMSYGEALYLTTKTSSSPALELKTTYTRKYKIDGAKSLSHILGYTGKISPEELKQDTRYNLNDARGRAGIEQSYENELRGIPGERLIEVDALGRQKQELEKTEPVDGNNVILTIDAEIQKKTEEILKQNMEEFGVKKGVVILSEPSTGEIRAMVSLPSFDSNMFTQLKNDEYAQLIQDPTKPLFNRAVNGEYPSGSTIKPLVAAAGLQEEILTARDTVLSTGGLRIGSWFFPDWKTGGHGVTNLRTAISQSVNTYFYIIGGGYGEQKGLGALKLIEYLDAFGIGRVTGIDLANEAPGLLPTPDWKQKVKNEQWYTGDTYHLAIGQGDVLVSPLQVNTYTNYFANNGVSYIPHLVQTIQDADGTPHETPVGEYLNDVVDKKHTDDVRSALRETVISGSGRYLASLPVTSAGKTGTAQWARDKKPHAWYTGWAPYDEPELSITVLLEEGEDGSKSTTRLVYDILDWYFTEYKVSKQKVTNESEVKELLESEDIHKTESQ